MKTPATGFFIVQNNCHFQYRMIDLKNICELEVQRPIIIIHLEIALLSNSIFAKFDSFGVYK